MSEPTREHWRKIPESNDYEVSSQGGVRSPRGELRPSRRRDYLCVTIWFGSVKRTCNVHVLVASAFLGERPSPAHVVRHLDGDSLDNRADNLAWGTASENVADTIRHGRHRQASRDRCPKGHPYSGDNLIVNKRGHRNCRECHNEGQRRAQADGKRSNAGVTRECPDCSRDVSLATLKRHRSKGCTSR